MESPQSFTFCAIYRMNPVHFKMERKTFNTSKDFTLMGPFCGFIYILLFTKIHKDATVLCPCGVTFVSLLSRRAEVSLDWISGGSWGKAIGISSTE